MSTWEQPHRLRQRLSAVACVLLLHAVVLYVLFTGLAEQGMQVARQVIDAYIVDDVAKEVPAAVPRPKPMEPQPKLKAPPLIAVPQSKPVQQQPAMVTPAPREAESTPSPAPTTAATAEAATPLAAAPPPSVGVSCPAYRQTLLDAGFPREATRAGVESGEVLLSFTITPSGGVKDVAIVNSSNRVFNRHSLQVVGQFRCQGQGRDVPGVQVPLVFTTR